MKLIMKRLCTAELTGLPIDSPASIWNIPGVE